MEKDKLGVFKEALEDMIKNGTINILATGYRGTEAWRLKREPLKKNKNGKKD